MCAYVPPGSAAESEAVEELEKPCPLPPFLHPFTLMVGLRAKEATANLRFALFSPQACSPFAAN